MKEIVFVDQFCEYLTELGLKYKREVRKGSYHSEGYMDVVIKNNGILIGVEAKISGFGDVFRQARRVGLYLPYSYILMPSLSKRSVEKCKDQGIGVIIFKNNQFQVIQKPKVFNYHYFWKKRYYKVLRNWIQNRCGRVISADSKELPEGYDLSKLKDVTPTYSWTTKRWDPHKIDWEGLGFTIYPQKLPPPKPKNKKIDQWL